MVCGGGSRNPLLMARLRHYCQAQKSPATDTLLALVAMTWKHLAFAWLAWRTLAGLPGNLPSRHWRKPGDGTLGLFSPLTRDIRVN